MKRAGSRMIGISSALREQRGDGQQAGAEQSGESERPGGEAGLQRVEGDRDAGRDEVLERQDEHGRELEQRPQRAV
jgi:hypothetical protein